MRGGRDLQRALGSGLVGDLLVEHDVEMVLDVCARVYVLEFGQLLAHGAPEGVRNNPEVIRAYLGAADTVVSEG